MVYFETFVSVNSNAKLIFSLKNFYLNFNLNKIVLTGHIEVVKALLNAGVDVHCRDSRSGWQPIHIAACKLNLIQILFLGKIQVS